MSQDSPDLKEGTNNGKRCSPDGRARFRKWLKALRRQAKKDIVGWFLIKELAAILTGKRPFFKTIRKKIVACNPINRDHLCGRLKDKWVGF